jgi:hypothetical protein
MTFHFLFLHSEITIIRWTKTILLVVHVIIFQTQTCKIRLISTIYDIWKHTKLKQNTKQFRKRKNVQECSSLYYDSSLILWCYKLIDMELPLILQDGNWNWTMALSQRAIVVIGQCKPQEFACCSDIFLSLYTFFSFVYYMFVCVIPFRFNTLLSAVNPATRLYLCLHKSEPRLVAHYILTNGMGFALSKN